MGIFFENPVPKNDELRKVAGNIADSIGSKVPAIEDFNQDNGDEKIGKGAKNRSSLYF
jgi:hypothetical protein